MRTLSAEDRKIVRKRIFIFYLVGLSLCFSDIAYRYISWQIQKADLVQVGNTGLWITPEKLKASKIKMASKNLGIFENGIVKSKLRLEELEQKLSIAQTDQTERIKGDIRREKYSLQKWEKLVSKFKDNLEKIK